jgi:Tfp pilus assembly protein PilV
LASVFNDRFSLSPCNVSQQMNRSGVVQLEVLVAGILLLVLASLLPSLGFHLSRIHKESLQYQIAVQTLANELERLRSIEPTASSRDLERLQLPAYASRRLPNATFQAVALQDDLGTRVKLSLQWDRVGKPPPVEMVGWLDTRAKSTGTENSQ